MDFGSSRALPGMLYREADLRIDQNSVRRSARTRLELGKRARCSAQPIGFSVLPFCHATAFALMGTILGPRALARTRFGCLALELIAKIETRVLAVCRELQRPAPATALCRAPDEPQAAAALTQQDFAHVSFCAQPQDEQVDAAERSAAEHCDSIGRRRVLSAIKRRRSSR
jgi:hypothetical protein